MIVSFAATATLALAVVFTVAAVSKLVNPDRTTAEFRDLGLPLPAVLARVVPLVEVVTVGLLLVEPRVGGLLAALLIAAFTAVLTAVLRDGRSVSCGCLGALSRKPVSRWTVARNGGLLLLAASASLLETLVVPDVAVVLTTGSTILLATMVVQLLVLQQRLGSIWDVTLAGEHEREEELILDLEIDLEIDWDQQTPTSNTSVSHPADREV